MSERFIKFIPSDEAEYLLLHKPNAFKLLYFIAKRARLVDGNPDGLKPGEAKLGDYESYGLTEKEYRTAKEILQIRNHIEVVETCRTRKKSKNGNTTKGTLVRLISANVYDLNLLLDKKSATEGATEGATDFNRENYKIKATEWATERATEGRPRGDEQEGLRMIEDQIDMIDVIDNARAREKNEKIDELIVFSHHTKNVVSILKKDLIQQMLDKAYSLSEVLEALAAMQKKNPKLNSEIQNYLEKILINKRKQEYASTKSKSSSNKSSLSGFVSDFSDAKDYIPPGY